ncbi:MAG: L-lactate dehydrogenase [Candidatus Thorarchaeota archaeon]|jgi:L-lactate dehydrogenase
MHKKQWKTRKVVIVGAGAVGATFVYALAQSGLADEIVLVDVNHELVKGQVLDLSHGLPYYPNVEISVGESDDYKDAHVVIITAGAKQKSGQSRLDLLQKNAAIIETVVDDITQQGSEAIIVVVSNPVDVLTYIAHVRTSWERGRVIGSGTVLDSARFRYLLSKQCNVDVQNVHAYVLGEHGDSQVAAWSMTHIAGTPIIDYCEQCGGCDGWEQIQNEIEETVRRSAYHIIEYKGATNYAVGLALLRIVGAILRDERSVLTVSVPLVGEYGLNNVSMGVPSIVSQNGVDSIIEVKLSSSEREALLASARILQGSIDGVLRSR